MQEVLESDILNHVTPEQEDLLPYLLLEHIQSIYLRASLFITYQILKVSLLLRRAVS